MEPDKNIAPEAEKSSYKLKSDIDTPGEELLHLRQQNKRKTALLGVAVLFMFVLSIALWVALTR